MVLEISLQNCLLTSQNEQGHTTVEPILLSFTTVTFDGFDDYLERVITSPAVFYITCGIYVITA